MAKKGTFAKELFLVDFMIVVYAICYQLQAPLEPYLVDRLVKVAGSGDASTQYAALQSFFSLIQMVGSLFIGGLIDKLGLRYAFILNFLACGASYGILASVETVNGLFISKLPTIFMTGFLCAQTAVVKLTEPGSDRVSQLGRLTTAYTIGGTLGPSLGGYLGTNVAARLAVIGSIGAAFLVCFLPSRVDENELQKHKTDGKHVNDDDGYQDSNEEGQHDKIKHQSWINSVFLVLSCTWPYLLTKFSATVANSMNSSIRPLILKNNFKLTESELGLVMSALFFGTALISLMLGQITKFIGSENKLIKTCIFGLFFGYGLQSIIFLPGVHLFIKNIKLNNNVIINEMEQSFYFLKYTFISLSLLISLFQFPLATTITSQSTSLVDSQNRGTLVGIEHCIYAFAGFCGPSIGVVVMESFSESGVALFAAFIFITIFILFHPKQINSQYYLKKKS